MLPLRAAAIVGGSAGEGASGVGDLLQSDICVVGAGPAGLAVATGAAALGVPVVLVERVATGGALRRAALPAAALIAAAARAEAVRQAAPFGIATGAPDVDFAVVATHLRRTAAATAPNDAVPRLAALGVRVVAGDARFRDRRTLAVGDTVIRARRFVLATGSVPQVPPGFDAVPYLTGDTLSEVHECPGRMLVLGGGPEALALAQAFRRLGAAVAVIAPAMPLGGEDPELAAAVLAAFVREGIELHAGATALAAGRSGADVWLEVEQAGARRRVEGSHLLIADRAPAVAALDLAAAGIACDAGGIRVGADLRTTNRRVYAVGDVTGGPGSAARARHEAGQVLRNALFRLPVRRRPHLLPQVVHTDPAIARVGLDEAAARARAGTIRVLRWPLAETDRAQADRETGGHVKLITDRRGRILGAAIVGARAGELVLPFVLAVEQGLSVRHFAGLPAPYPSAGEAGARAALAFYAPYLTAAWVRRIISLLRRLG